MAPGGELLQDLLGAGGTAEGAREREENLDALRERAQTPSPGLGESEPVLDYLLGGEGR